MVQSQDVKNKDANKTKHEPFLIFNLSLIDKSWMSLTVSLWHTSSQACGFPLTTIDFPQLDFSCFYQPTTLIVSVLIVSLGAMEEVNFLCIFI